MCLCFQLSRASPCCRYVYEQDPKAEEKKQGWDKDMEVIMNKAASDGTRPLDKDEIPEKYWPCYLREWSLDHSRDQVSPLAVFTRFCKELVQGREAAGPDHVNFCFDLLNIFKLNYFTSNEI